MTVTRGQRSEAGAPTNHPAMPTLGRYVAVYLTTFSSIHFSKRPADSRHVSPSITSCARSSTVSTSSRPKKRAVSIKPSASTLDKVQGGWERVLGEEPQDHPYSPGSRHEPPSHRLGSSRHCLRTIAQGLCPRMPPNLAGISYNRPGPGP